MIGGSGAFWLPAHMTTRKRAPSTKPRQHPEQDLQMKVAAFFRKHIDRSAVPWTAIGHGVYFTRNQEEARRRGKKLKDMGVNPGWPDLHLIHNRRSCYIELKSEKGTLSEAQREVQTAITLAGGVWATCRSLDDVLNILEVWGVPIIP
jgi:hypothetical protein